MSGGASLLQALCLRRLLAEGVRPDLLVLEVLPPALNQPGDHPLEEAWLDGARLRWGEKAFLSRYHSEPQRSLRQWLKGRGLPCVWHHGDLRSLVALDTGDGAAGPERLARAMDSHGWLTYGKEDVTPEQRRWHTDFAGLQYDDAWGDFRLAERPARVLADMLALCRQRGIPVALLLMPEGPAFRAHYTPSMCAGIDAYLRDLRTRWGVPVVDARDWLPEDSFWDSHHLLPRGATAFTRRFEREALGPLLGATVTMSPTRRPEGGG
jgi:hypothetical protein